ncbi:hypothetical protein, partial [Escherichia coli]|uniref:hypothetical protein n=1 Tax=Escherichia coli TaxID=562 RepID=UPI001BFC34EB
QATWVETKFQNERAERSKNISFEYLLMSEAEASMRLCGFVFGLSLYGKPSVIGIVTLRAHLRVFIQLVPRDWS